MPDEPNEVQEIAAEMVEIPHSQYQPSSLDVLCEAAQIQCMKEEIDGKNTRIKFLEGLEAENRKLRQENTKLTNELMLAKFSFQSIMMSKDSEKLMKFYTGLHLNSFSALHKLLTCDGNVNYPDNRFELSLHGSADHLLLTLARLRRNFQLLDLSHRFGISINTVSIIFNNWVNHMYSCLIKISIWPHRDVILKNAPSEFIREFPQTIMIIDCTELKTQTPSSLRLQSQFYSDYKSHTTLKGLVGCDPGGAVIFVGELFTGSISDKNITEQCGLYRKLQKMMDLGYIAAGDAIMADKGFTIESDIKKLNLNLNIPPRASAHRQMPGPDCSTTRRIARHRIHIERLIGRIEEYRILTGVVPCSIIYQLNKIWTINSTKSGLSVLCSLCFKIS